MHRARVTNSHIDWVKYQNKRMISLQSNFKDLTGTKIGRWSVIERAEDHITKSGTHFTMWKCKCDCGKEKVVYANALLNGKSKSCGCYGKERASIVCSNNFSNHKESKTRLYKIWSYMKKRCLNKESSNYFNYGGRGISICDEWTQYDSFRDWAISNGYRDDLSIDRIDVNGNYCPSNCRWATSKEQSNNRRSTKYYTFDGETHTISEWAELVGVSYKCMYKRLSKGKCPN